MVRLVDNHISRTAGRENASPRVEFSRLRNIKLHEYAIRFMFGGTISVICAIIGHQTNSYLGGVFTAFPAILLASLTLIGHHDGDGQSSEDAEGGVLGALAFIPTALLIAFLLPKVAGSVALVLSLLFWFVVSCGVYMVTLRFAGQHSDNEPHSDPQVESSSSSG